MLCLVYGLQFLDSEYQLVCSFQLKLLADSF